MNISGWVGIASNLGLAAKTESDLHVHVSGERAELFHAADCGSTEFEYLNLLHALVLATKPMNVLETGTFNGYGTLALASAIKANGVGILTTVDCDPCPHARRLINDAGLEAVVQFVTQDAVKFCSMYSGTPFEFVFHDSGGERTYEHQLLMERGRVAPGGLVTFHDASPLRCGPSPNSWIEGLAGLPNAIWFNLSRGFRLIQV